MKVLANKINALKYILGPKYKKSYSQCGEDLIIDRLLKHLDIQKPFYIDIGANDPVIYSNTYLFYKNGAAGICVEPNLALCEKIKLKRPRDITLPIGIGEKVGTRSYFMFNSNALNTFSPEEAKGTERKGFKIVNKTEIPIKRWDDIIKENNVKKIDFLSLDVEGLDLEILKIIDWNNIRPKIICVETQSFGTSENHRNESPIENLLGAQGYEIAGMTPINKIFLDKKLK